MEVVGVGDGGANSSLVGGGEVVVERTAVRSSLAGGDGEQLVDGALGGEVALSCLNGGDAQLVLGEGGGGARLGPRLLLTERQVGERRDDEMCLRSSPKPVLPMETSSLSGSFLGSSSTRGGCQDGVVQSQVEESWGLSLSLAGGEIELVHDNRQKDFLSSKRQLEFVEDVDEQRLRKSSELVDHSAILPHKDNRGDQFVDIAGAGLDLDEQTLVSLLEKGLVSGSGIVSDRKDTSSPGREMEFIVNTTLSEIKLLEEQGKNERRPGSFLSLDLHTVSVPFATGYKECVVYFESIGVQDWKLVDRARVCRCIPFIASATWKGRSRMDLSEFPCLSDRFSGGSSSIALVEPGLDVAPATGAVSLTGAALATGAVSATGVEPSTGVASATGAAGNATGSEPSGDRCQEKRVASGKTVVSGKAVVGSKGASVSKGNVPKKRPADASLSKEVSTSKVRKVSKEAPEAISERDRVIFQPFQFKFGGSMSYCANLVGMFRMEDEPEYESSDPADRAEWYEKHARAVFTSQKYVNRLVNSQADEINPLKAELEKANAKLAADRSGEVASWRKKYDAEKKVALAAQKEVENLTKRISLDAERAKKRQDLEAERYEKAKEQLRKRYDRAITRHNDVLATCNSRARKMKSFVDDQNVVRQSKYGMNQVKGVLDCVKVWKEEGIMIPEFKVKNLEKDLVARVAAAKLVIPVKMEDKDLAEIPPFDFSIALDPVLPSLTEGLEDAVKAREMEEEARRLEDAARRRSERGSGSRPPTGRDSVAPSRK